MKHQRQVFVPGYGWVDQREDHSAQRGSRAVPLTEAEQVIANARAAAFDRQTRRVNRMQTRIGWGVILTAFVIIVSRCAS